MAEEDFGIGEETPDQAMVRIEREKEEKAKEQKSKGSVITYGMIQESKALKERQRKAKERNPITPEQDAKEMGIG